MFKALFISIALLGVPSIASAEPTADRLAERMLTSWTRMRIYLQWMLWENSVLVASALPVAI